MLDRRVHLFASRNTRLIATKKIQSSASFFLPLQLHLSIKYPNATFHHVEHRVENLKTNVLGCHAKVVCAKWDACATDVRWEALAKFQKDRGAPQKKHSSLAISPQVTDALQGSLLQLAKRVDASLLQQLIASIKKCDTSSAQLIEKECFACVLAGHFSFSTTDNLVHPVYLNSCQFVFFQASKISEGHAKYSYYPNFPLPKKSKTAYKKPEN